MSGVNHLSVRTTALPRTVVMSFTSCNFKMGDEFVNHVNEVTCPDCLDRIRVLFSTLEEQAIDEPLLRDAAEVKAVKWLHLHRLDDDLTPEYLSLLVNSLADLLQGQAVE